MQIYLPPDLFDFSGTLKLSGGAIKEAIKTRYISKKIGVDTLKEYHLLLAGMLMTSLKLQFLYDERCFILKLFNPQTSCAICMFTIQGII